MTKKLMLCRTGPLLAVIVLQWLLLTYVLYAQHENSGYDAHGPSKFMKESSPANPSSSQSLPTTDATAAEDAATTATATAKAVDDMDKIDKTSSGTIHRTEFKGVAVTLALKAPKWFHRRYTSMLYNVLNSIPEDWALQIVIQPEWWQNEVIKLHRGMPRLLEHHKSRIILTELPKTVWKHRPKQIMVSSWFWENVVAERAFVFSGNGVVCPHSKVSFDHFDGIDWVGSPSRHHSGGDGTAHSLRSRSAMLDAIRYANEPPDYMPPSDTMFFVSNLRKMNNEGTKDKNKDRDGTSNERQYRLATTEETVLFGGGADLITEATNRSAVRPDMEEYGPSLVLSGTGMDLDFQVRESLLFVCPEWKIIFPSLHDPNCFGANPNAEQCAASICALKKDRPKQGC